MTLPIVGPNELLPGETREPEVNWLGQFRIKCPDGRARWYTRATAFINNLEDTTLIQKWHRRVTLDGFLKDPELWFRYQQIPPEPARDTEDKRAANDLLHEAFVAGGGEDKSSTGTRLHALTYDWDMGFPVDTTNESDLADLRSYLTLCDWHGLRFVVREQRVVIDHRKVTGTPDHVFSGYRCLDGRVRNVIGDLKTSPRDDLSRYGAGKMAQQLAMYAEGELYEDDGTETGRRWPFPVEVSNEVGLILHVPQGGAVQGQRPVLYEVDLTAGRYGVSLSGKVREWRNFSKSVFTEVPAR